MVFPEPKAGREYLSITVEYLSLTVRYTLTLASFQCVVHPGSVAGIPGGPRWIRQTNQAVTD